MLLQHPRAPANGAPAGCGHAGTNEQLRHGQNQSPVRDETSVRQDGVLHSLVRPTIKHAPLPPTPTLDDESHTTETFERVLDAGAFNNLIRDALSFRRGEHQVGAHLFRHIYACSVCWGCAASFRRARTHVSHSRPLTSCHLQDVAEFHSQLLELLSAAFAKCSTSAKPADPKPPKPRQKMSDEMIELTTELQVKHRS